MSSDDSDILRLVASGWKHLPVLVIGDVMLDQYVWGEVERISPEAPVPVIRATQRDEKPGGAANVAMNLAALGACVTLIGFAGADREQSSLESLLAEQGIESTFISTPHVSTTSKLRIISGHQQMMRLDVDPVSPFGTEDYARLKQRALAAIDRTSVVLLSDYAKGTLTEEVCQSVIMEASRRKIPVLVDPKHRDFRRYRGATSICPNAKELSVATGEPMQNLDCLLAAGQSLIPSLGLEFMAVTLGEKGIALLRHDSRIHAPAVVRQVYDVSGAGDTVIAVLALALGCHVPMQTAIEIANAAAGIVVNKIGTVPVQRRELLGVLATNSPTLVQEKVMELDLLVAQVAAWRSSGKRIVFTNGCFDILHIGHIHLLEEARRKGDRLIVGLNSDESVRDLKGASRPIIGQGERAQVLAALSAVNAVIVFRERTPLRLIEAIRPDVLVKGGDYTQERIVGAREVRAWGGRVEIVPLVGGVSTTRLINAGAMPAKPVVTMPPTLQSTCTT
jgi:D-beta-D-heptose 7-phosphate kinase/D-beta-D-heptose 1-phosphate adenosyltransferase